MNQERLGPSPLPPDLPPEPIEDTDLLEDLRNLIVTEDSESLRTMASIVTALQARIEDRQGLIDLLKPVIDRVIRERVAEDPEAMREALRPLVEDVVRETADPVGRNDRGAGLAVLDALQSVSRKARAIFSRGRPHRKTVVVESPAEGPPPEVCDADFALCELFLLAHPSLVLLAHGSWQPPHFQVVLEEQLLPMIRRFITSKARGEEAGEPLRARFDRFHVHIEPAQHAVLVVVFEGTPPLGFLLDVRQTLVDIQTKFTDSLRRSRPVPQYRGALRLLLDRYRPTESRMGAHAHEDPIKWPPPASP
jgi:hypothetical protein